QSHGGSMSFPEYPGSEDVPNEDADPARGGSPSSSPYPQYPRSSPDPSSGTPGDAAPEAGQVGEHGQYGAPPPYPGGYQTEPPLVARPTKVLVGCIMAWIGGAVGVVGGVFYATIKSDSTVLHAYKVSDRSAVLHALHVLGPILAVWSVAVIVLAVLAFRRTRWAAVALLAMGIVFILLSAVGSVTGSGGTGIVPFVWVLFSTGLIYGLRDAKAWFKARPPQAGR
ncbi:MAG: hypothetical protein ACRDPG_03155, partial [Nocardioidaceae bacterium]